MTDPVESLANLGAEIVDVALPARFADLGRDQRAHHVGRGLRGARPTSSMTTPSRWTRMCGRECAPERRSHRRDYLTALAERERMKASFNAAIEGVDALLTPTAVDARPTGGLDRSEHDAGDVHALGQFPRPLRGGGAERVHRGWVADVAADRLPGLCRAAGAAHRLCLPGRARLAPAGSADGSMSQVAHLSCQYPTRRRTLQISPRPRTFKGGTLCGAAC